MAVAKDADALLVTYAKITADMIRANEEVQNHFALWNRRGQRGHRSRDARRESSSPRCRTIASTKFPTTPWPCCSPLVRKIPFSSARAHAGRWEMPAVMPIHRLRGTVLGLVGFGRIPQLVAPKAKAFGMRVVAYRSVRAARR